MKFNTNIYINIRALLQVNKKAPANCRGLFERVALIALAALEATTQAQP
jgi:hypothetical protein